MATTATPILSIEHVNKSFRKDRHQELLVLDNVQLKLRDKEIVALLGKSGSGKSTLLRIMAGLVQPSAGQVKYKNQKIEGPVPGIAMVFQNFALLPWLTVLQNVELGLEALNVPRTERRERALKAIDTVGLDGFESAFPKELSGGMRQRVGFARALVVNPTLLLMDEPFSALDVLTAENLRNDLLNLWLDKQGDLNAICLVTHNIEEAVLLADRIIIFDNSPGNIRADLRVPLSYPRDFKSPEFTALVDEIYSLMTTERTVSSKGPQEEEIEIGHRLPDTSPDQLTGLLETVAEEGENNCMDLPELADSLQLDIDDLFPITEAAQILCFAEISDGDISLTNTGIEFAGADILQRKKIFACQVLEHVPLAVHIRKILDFKEKHSASQEEFLTELVDFLSDEEAERVLRVAIDWGRYAELFAFDFNSGVLSLENPE